MFSSDAKDSDEIIFPDDYTSTIPKCNLFRFNFFHLLLLICLILVHRKDRQTNVVKCRHIKLSNNLFKNLI